MLDVGALLRGRAELVPSERIVASSVLTGEEWTLSRAELDLLLALPADRWTDAAGTGADAETLERLARQGLVVSDDPEGPLAELRRADERLTAAGWHPTAALLHFVGKWRDVDLGIGPEFWGEDATGLGERYEAFVERHGPPPPAFRSLGGERRPLPLVRGEGGLYEALVRRRTTRAFDREAPLALDRLALLLYEVFGCHGYAEVAEGVTVLARTSPSGGARHSLEAYPLLLNVDGAEPGLYHYDVRDHALEPVRLLERADASALAVAFSAGQGWMADAAAVVLVTSRFGRMLWKYRRNNRAYLTLFVEAGHFSQSFYLVCADLGLGAFVSAAVNGGNVEHALGLDPLEEGVLAICGCGVPLPGPHALQPRFLPYVPRETPIPGGIDAKDMPAGE